MKFRILSDIHLDGGRLRRQIPVCDQLDNILTPPCDGLIFAGDLSNTDDDKIEALECMTQAYKQVIVVLGNHDCWHKSFPPTELQNRIKAIAPGRLHLLEDSHVDIDGTRIHGSTLWFKKTTISKQIDKSFADFRFIPNSQELYKAHEHSVTYLRNYVRKNDVVITHHTPSLKSVPEQFVNDLYTCFFSNDLDWLVKQIQPKIWIHGHTHNYFDYQLGDTRILCNPYGYENEQSGYKSLVIDL